MFTDNGEAFRQTAFANLHSSLAVFASAMETMDPQKLLRIAEHQGKGARWAIRSLGPGGGEPPTMELGLWHPEAGWLELVSVALPPLVQH